MSCFFIQDELLFGDFVLIGHDKVHTLILNKKRGVKYAAFRQNACVDIMLGRFVPFPPITVFAHFRWIISLLLGSVRLFIGFL